MKFLLKKIPDKPLFFEVRNQVCRSSGGAVKGNQVATIVVVLIGFSLLAYTFLSSAKYIPLVIPMFILPALATIVLPGTLASVISGEIQKRSLEPLLSAPITALTLVKAKALRALLPVVFIYLGVLVLILLIGLGKLVMGNEPMNNVRNPSYGIVSGTLSYLSLAYCLTGLSLAVSAVTRTSVASLLTIWGIVIGIYVIVPAIVMPVAMAINPFFANYLIATHPYGLITIASFRDIGVDTNTVGLVISACLGFFLNLCIGYGGMVFAARRVAQFKSLGTGA